jgi:hypothetical protein
MKNERKSFYLQHFQLQIGFFGIFSVGRDAPSLYFHAVFVFIVAGKA